MRRVRVKGEPEAEEAYYHCISRIVDRRFILEAPQKETFVRLMRGYESYCGVQIITFCVMSNHFHILLRVPKRPATDLLPSDAELVERLRAADGSYGAQTLAQQLENLRASGRHQDAETLRERFFSTMWDVSYFMRVLKQRFSQWYNGTNDRKGTLWEERFRSVLVEAGSPLRAVALYIDLNPFRAGMVDDPKNYRWCGYAEAVAGVPSAREAIAGAMDMPCPPEDSLGKSLAAYRIELFEAGGIPMQKTGDEGYEQSRHVFLAQQIESVRLVDGKLGIREELRCRVRYFTEGLVLGSVGFVEHHFERYRRYFGKIRLRGACPVGVMAALELHSLVS
jgi:putative transposase